MINISEINQTKKNKDARSSSTVASPDNQIYTNYQETQDIIKKTFDRVLQNVTKTLIARRDDLLKQAEESKEETFLRLRNHHLDSENTELRSNNGMPCNRFYEGTEHKVSHFTFQDDKNAEAEMLNICAKFGVLFHTAPVQISQMMEKPGGISVEWQCNDAEERLFDIQEFRLQKTIGDVIKDKRLNEKFSDCFLGLDSQYLARDLQLNQPYSFRVCCKLEGFSQWSPWSLPKVFSTSIPPFCWKQNDDYRFADDNRIAVPVKSSPSLLKSDGPQFSVGYTIEFTYLEFDDMSTVGLIGNSNGQITDIDSPSHQYFALHSNGEIYVDGLKKSTKLPQICKGTKVCFTCECLENGKVRVNVDCCEKRVTYDWQITSPNKIYFAASLTSPKSKIMVE